jgi:hypothetical protein
MNMFAQVGLQNRRQSYAGIGTVRGVGRTHGMNRAAGVRVSVHLELFLRFTGHAIFHEQEQSGQRPRWPREGFC